MNKCKNCDFKTHTFEKKTICNCLYNCDEDLFVITLFFFLIALVSIALPSEDPPRRPNDPFGVGGILIVAPLLGGVTRKG